MLKPNVDAKLVKNHSNGSFVLSHAASNHSVTFSAEMAAALFDVETLNELAEKHTNNDNKPNTKKNSKPFVPEPWDVMSEPPAKK